MACTIASPAESPASTRRWIYTGRRRPSRSAQCSQMELDDLFSRKIRWLAIVVGLSAAALSCFLTPLAAFVPALLALGAASQPSLPDPGKRIVKWFMWAWALGWSPYLVGLSFLLLNSLPHTHYFMALRVSSTLSTLLILWWDIELIADGTKRMVIWCSAPVQQPRPVSWGLWILAAALNLWVGWGLANIISIYHGVGDLSTLVMSMAEAVIVAAFDAYLTWRVVRMMRVS